MSELTKLLKLFTTHKTNIEELRLKVWLYEESGNWEEGRNTLESLRMSVNVLLNDIIPNSDKFYTKIGTTDPVTGLNRYGVNTEAKISELKINALLLQSDCETFLLTLTEKVELHCPIAIPTLLSPISNDTVTSIFTFDAAKNEKDTELENQRLLQEKVELELAKKAQAVRERKAQEAMEQSQFEETISTKLLSIERYINNGASSGGGLQVVLDSIVAHYKQIGSPRSGVELLKMAVSIVERVINKPDDAACRRLRVTHPMLLAKLTGLFGGMELMVAVGFRLKVTAPSDSSAASSRPEDQKVTSSYSATIREVISHSEESPEYPSSSTLEVFTLLSPHTVWDGVLEMFEPALDLSASKIGGKNAWIEWFDELTSSRDAINIALKQLQ